jgi:PEP-CTERM/exosortase A-associated glycosyltransferase
VTLRILHVLDHSLPQQSGYTFRTLSILREQRARGWQTLQLTTPKQGGGTTEQEVVDGWTFHRTPFPAADAQSSAPFKLVRQMAATHRRLASLIDQFAPDVLHAHSPVLTVYPALWAARRAGIPVVYEVRALWEDGAVDHGVTRPGSVRYRASRALETFALKQASRVTTICQGLQGEIASRGVPCERITVIPNAVDPQAFVLDPPPDEGLRSRLSLDGVAVVGFIGSFYGYEGLDLLIDAFARLRQRTRARLLLVGGGPCEPALRAQVERLGLDGDVHFAGRVPHDEVQRYYSVVDVLVYPRWRNRVTELVTPLKPLEAMAQGRMLVASDVGGHRELIRDRETGYLFPAGSVDGLVDAIEAVLRDRDAWPRLKARARGFVESERTWSNSVARYAGVYEAALRERRAPAAHARLRS